MKIGDKFDEEWEHHISTFIVTKIENNRVFAKEIINENKQIFGEEQSFSEDELLHGNTFCSYWFHKGEV